MQRSALFSFPLRSIPLGVAVLFSGVPGSRLRADFRIRTADASASLFPGVLLPRPVPCSNVTLFRLQEGEFHKPMLPWLLTSLVALLIPRERSLGKSGSAVPDLPGEGKKPQCVQTIDLAVSQHPLFSLTRWHSVTSFQKPSARGSPSLHQLGQVPVRCLSSCVCVFTPTSSFQK